MRVGKHAECAFHAGKIIGHVIDDVARVTDAAHAVTASLVLVVDLELTRYGAGGPSRIDDGRVRGHASQAAIDDVEANGTGRLGVDRTVEPPDPFDRHTSQRLDQPE